ncbi:hypothetical protein CPB86DRAFT_615287 [Serendipita vermifera]|nr:hypothetical protein CPB86DRAFT_615287 [Serendipita vermifera]
MDNRTINIQEGASHLSGRCHCGAISFEISIPPSLDLDSSNVPQALKNNLVAPSRQRFPNRGIRPNSNKWRANHCHCTTCRQTVGGLIVTWVSIPDTHIKMVKSGPTGKYRASNRVTREFCQTCGTSLFFLEDEEPDVVGLTVASITTSNVFDYVEIGDHIWVEDVSSLRLDKEGKGGGIAAILEDGLPRTVRERGSTPC